MVAAQDGISFNSPEMFEEIDGKCALADVSNDKQEVIYTFEGDAHNSAWYLEGNVIIAKFSVSSLQDFSCPVLSRRSVTTRKCKLHLASLKMPKRESLMSTGRDAHANRAQDTRKTQPVGIIQLLTSVIKPLASAGDAPAT